MRNVGGFANVGGFGNVRDSAAEQASLAKAKQEAEALAAAQRAAQENQARKNQETNEQKKQVKYSRTPEQKKLLKDGNKVLFHTKKCHLWGNDFLESKYTYPALSGKIATNNHKSLETLESNDENHIPLTTHHIWLTSSTKPRELSENMITWAQKSATVLAEGWKHVFWVNDKKLIPNSIKKLSDYGYEFKEISELGKLYIENEFNAAMKQNKFGLASDILRYEILNKVGGLYFDTDYDILANPAKIHSKADFYTGIEPFDGGSKVCGFKYGNAIIASKPDHIILQKMLEHIKIWSNPLKAPPFLEKCDSFDYTIYVTGPFGFSKVFLENSGLGGNVDLTLKPEQVYSMEYMRNGGENVNLPKDLEVDHVSCRDVCTLLNSENEELTLGYHYWSNTWTKSEFGSNG